MGTIRSPAMVVLLTLLTLGLYGFAWLYSFNVEIRDAGMLRFRVGRYMLQFLFLFALVLTIPLGLILFYAFLYRGALNVAIVQERLRIQKPLHVRTAFFASLVPFLGFLVYQAMLQSAGNVIWKEQAKQPALARPRAASATVIR